MKIRTITLIISLVIIILAGPGCKPKKTEPTPGVEAGNNQQAGVSGKTTFAFVMDETKYETASSVIEIRDGEFLVLGDTGLQGKGRDGYIVKMNKYGTFIQERIYNREGEEYFYKIIKALDTGYMIIGLTQAMGSDDWDIYLLKIDNNLNPVWEKTYSRPGWDNCNAIMATESANYVIVGDIHIAGREDSEFYLLNIDKNGNPIWEKTYGTEGNDTGRSVLQTDDQGYILSGYGGDKGLDVITLRTDNNGNQLWMKFAGAELNDRANDSLYADGENFITTGMREIRNGSAMGMQIYTVKFNPDGDVLWEKDYSFPGREIALAQTMTRTRDGNYIIGASVMHQQDIGFDLGMIKIDSAGEVIWQHVISGLNDQYEYCLEILATLDDHYFLSGYLSKKVIREEEGMKKTLYLGRYGYVAKFDSEGGLD